MQNPSTGRRTSRAWRGIAVVPLLVLLAAFPAGAAVLTVDTTVDEFDLMANGTCSLREAVESANRNTDFGGCLGEGTYDIDTILLPAGTYGLTRTPAEDFLDLDNSVGDLDVTIGIPEMVRHRGTEIDRGITLTGTLAILGDGAQTTIIERAAGEPFGIVQVDRLNTLRLVDLTVRGGEQVAGGGIFADWDLRLERVVVRDNVARAPDAGGGGIVAFDRLTLLDTLVTNNRVELEDPCDFGPLTTGGGIIAFNFRPISIERSTISANTVTGDPGCEGFGGGLGVLAGFALVRVANSTVSGNSATVAGGIDLLTEGFFGGEAFSGLRRRPARSGSTPSWGPRRGAGLDFGAVPPPPTTISLEHVTLTANSAEEIGGLSLLSFDETGEVVIQNTLIGANTAADAPDCSRFGVTVVPQGTNLLSIDEPLPEDEVCLTEPPDLVGTLANPLPPLLGPLQNNGGSTPTHALLIGSPALDAAPNVGEIEDQRSVPRPQGDAFDIGAFEAVVLEPVLAIPTLGGWGLMLLVAGLMMSGLWFLRR